MALETATYTSDLVATNPTSGDPKSQGDDHLRLIKSTLQNTFPNITGAVTGTHTEINDAVQRVLTSGTAQATTSGTSKDFTSIPSWVKKITVMFAGVSTNGTSVPMIQIGDSGGIENTGYSGSVDVIQNASATATASFSSGFSLSTATSAASVYQGVVVLTNLDGNTWIASINMATSNVAATLHGAGSKTLSATLDRVRLTTAGGTDTFDAGSVNVMYE